MTEELGVVGRHGAIIGTGLDDLEGVRCCLGNGSNLTGLIDTDDRAGKTSDELHSRSGDVRRVSVVSDLDVNTIRLGEDDHNVEVIILGIEIQRERIGSDVVLNELGVIDRDLALDDCDDMIVREPFLGTQESDLGFCIPF